MKNKLLAFLVVVLSASGCVGWHVPAVTSLATIPDGESIVLGKVKVVVSGEEVLDEIIFGNREDIYSSFVVWIVPETGSTYGPHWVTRKEKGEFYWHLPPGTYDIAALGYQHNSITNNQMTRIIRPMHVRFTIPNDGKLVYVGSLVITFADKDALSSRSFVLHIEDQHENALDALQRKFPETKGDMAKHLMSLVKMR